MSLLLRRHWQFVHCKGACYTQGAPPVIHRDMLVTMNLLSQHQPYRFHAREAVHPVYVPPNYSPTLELALVFEGSITMILDGKAKVINGPCAALSVCRSSLAVNVEARQPTRVAWCNCRDVRLNEMEWHWLRNIPSVMPIHSRLQALFDSALMTEADENCDLFSRQVHDALGVACFSEFFRVAGSPPAQLSQAIFVVKQHIDTHFGDVFDAAALAAIVAMPLRRMNECFRKEMGLSLSQYLWQRRVEEGARALMQSNRTIEAIAYACGFESAAHFSRKIKQAYGRSPKQLRVPGTLPALM